MTSPGVPLARQVSGERTYTCNDVGYLCPVVRVRRLLILPYRSESIRRASPRFTALCPGVMNEYDHEEARRPMRAVTIFPTAVCMFATLSLREHPRDSGSCFASLHSPMCQTVDFDEFLPDVMAAWRGVAKHRVSHIHLAFDRYCSTFQARRVRRNALACGSWSGKQQKKGRNDAYVSWHAQQSHPRSLVLLAELDVKFGFVTKTQKNRPQHRCRATMSVDQFRRRCIRCLQVTEEMRFATDEAPKARDAVILQVTVENGLGRGRRSVWGQGRVERACM